MDSCRVNAHNRQDFFPGSVMKLLFDLFPVILFFAAFKYAGAHPDAAAALMTRSLGSPIDAMQAPILVATGVVILATIGQIAWVAWRHGKVDRMLWVSLVLVVGLGSLTLLLHDETFIKWKPTVLYWVMAGGMGGAALLFGRNAIRSMLGEQIVLPEPVWTRLNLAWIAFFGFMGALNLFVALNYPTDVWVNFKLFGGMGLLVLFIIVQGLFLSRYVEAPAAHPDADKSKAALPFEEKS